MVKGDEYVISLHLVFAILLSINNKDILPLNIIFQFYFYSSLQNSWPL